MKHIAITKYGKYQLIIKKLTLKSDKSFSLLDDARAKRHEFLQYYYHALLFLKLYPTEDVAAANFNAVRRRFDDGSGLWLKGLVTLDLVTVETFTSFYRQLINTILDTLERSYQDWSIRTPCCAIDGTDCWIQENPYKLNHDGLPYEVAVSLGTSQIFWWSGGGCLAVNSLTSP